MNRSAALMRLEPVELEVGGQAPTELHQPRQELARPGAPTHLQRACTRDADLDLVAFLERQLVQLEAQTQAALALLERASPEQRDAFLAQVAELRGRLARLRAAVSGPTAPVLVRR